MSSSKEQLSDPGSFQEDGMTTAPTQGIEVTAPGSVTPETTGIREQKDPTAHSVSAAHGAPSKSTAGEGSPPMTQDIEDSRLDRTITSLPNLSQLGSFSSESSHEISQALQTFGIKIEELEQKEEKRQLLIQSNSQEIVKLSSNMERILTLLERAEERRTRSAASPVLSEVFQPDMRPTSSTTVTEDGKVQDASVPTSKSRLHPVQRVTPIQYAQKNVPSVHQGTDTSRLAADKPHTIATILYSTGRVPGGRAGEGITESEFRARTSAPHSHTTRAS